MISNSHICAASAFLFGAYGLLFTASFPDTFGHRRAMALDAILCLAVLTVNAFTTNIVVMCVARVMVGKNFTFNDLPFLATTLETVLFIHKK